MRLVPTAILILAIFLVVRPQATKELMRDKPAANNRRVALVIGNGQYELTGSLPNPSNDAEDMRKSLNEIGFEVIGGSNLSRREMIALIREFGQRIMAGGTGLFYYSGHGIQASGQNYLIPVDADIQSEDEVEFQAVSLNLVLTKMATARNDLNIVILDACRNNPYLKSWRALGRGSSDDGLARVSPPTGTLVLYAARPGEVALEGKGRNGMFTESLLKQIKVPGLEYDAMVKVVSADVWERSNRQQFPWKEGNSLKDFYFVPSVPGASLEPTKNSTITIDKDDGQARLEASKPTPSPSQPPEGSKPTSSPDLPQPNSSQSGGGAPKKPDTESTSAASPKVDPENEAWELVNKKLDIDLLRLFLKQFPGGAHSEKARSLMDNMIWSDAKASNDAKKVQTYLDEFPRGENIAAAQILLKQLQPIVSTIAPPSSPWKNATGIELVWVPPGSFMMGSATGDARERPVRRITITEGFWMSKFEITQLQWTTLMNINPSKFSQNCGGSCPVERVSWNEIQEFIGRLNQKNDGFIYTLPTEAEWEYAARAGGDGDHRKDLREIAWFKSNAADRTHQVGTKKPNAFGIYDMFGNVWEWCSDWYARYPINGEIDPVGPANGSTKVLKGGSWKDSASDTRVSYRADMSPTFKYQDTGFRVIAKQKSKP